jgi:TRAP transporter 4TM/12TM fusion protein
MKQQGAPRERKGAADESGTSEQQGPRLEQTGVSPPAQVRGLWRGFTGLGIERNQLVAVLALAWCAFQFWVASPLPVMSGWLIIGEARVRSLHLAFALLLAYASFPGRRGDSPSDRLSPVGLALALAAAFTAAQLFLFYRQISAIPGDPKWWFVATAACGVVLLLEGTRRVLGMPMVLLVLAMLAYLFFGAYAPDLIAHKGASLSKAMGHLWLSTEGVFGVALGVSAGFIFLFVVFGSLLDTAGAGTYFVRSALSLVGHARGGPAKAAVGVSAATGMVSGSSITNIVTSGPLTIPLIKRVGYPPEKAAAIEVASSVNGQVMPPVMGAAAFLMVEYVGIPYLDVLKHALISALISYLGLLYIVHLEAVKAGFRGLPHDPGKGWQSTAKALVTGVLAAALVVALLVAVSSAVAAWLPVHSPWVMTALLVVAYLATVRIASRHALSVEEAEAPVLRVPPAGPTLKSGLHFLLPVGLLVWLLVVERVSPGRAAFWALLFLVVVVLTQRPLLAWFAGRRDEIGIALRHGLADLRAGLITGARNMVVVAVATATAGIIVGTVTLTGVGLVMTEVVETLSRGNVLLMLVMVAMVCLVLGVGLPTTANYIVVSTLMAPVIVAVGAQNGLAVPLIAAHLFVFYFGLLADILPPVGLASYAAASIAGANPIRTGVVAFRYMMRMALLPFMFVFNPQLLLIGVHGIGHTLITLASATLAGLVFIAVNQNWFMTRNLWWERLLLLLATLMLFHPGLFMDRVKAPYVLLSGEAALQAVVDAAPGAPLRVVFEGTLLGGREVERTVLFTMGEYAANAGLRLSELGMTTRESERGLHVDSVRPRSQAARLELEPGFELVAVAVASGRAPKEWIFVPAVMLIGWIAWRQRRRGEQSPQPA